MTDQDAARHGVTKPAIVVALTGWTLEPWLRRLRAMAPARAIVVASDPAQPLPERYHLFCWKPAPALLRRTPAPLLVLSGGAGVDHILKADPPAGIPITRVVDPDLTQRMVEYVVLHALYHLRRMDVAAARQQRNEWKADHFPAAREVTIGLMGVGELGLAAGRALKGLGFNVIGWGRSGRAGLPFASYAGAAGLDDFLGRTDMLVCLLPSTGETRGLIDAALLRRLRRTGPFGPPVLINAGRGDVVRQNELVAALEDGTLRAASLDVFEIEPLPATSPLWSMPQVVITPHNAADSHPDAVVAAIMAEIDRFEAGMPLLNAIDASRGY